MPSGSSTAKVTESVRTNGVSVVETEEETMPEACPVPSKDFIMVATSSSREMRNKAEKQRRDRINSFIGQLHTLLPLVSKSAKRMDKISVLRLTAAHLRLYHTLAKTKEMPHMNLPNHVDQFLLEQLICDELGGFLIILSPDGKIIFISSTVENLLGHLQTDLMGESLYSVTAEEDRDRLKLYLQCEGDLEQGWRKYFSIRMKRAGPRSEPAVFETIKMMGIQKQLQQTDGSSGSSSSTALVPSTSASQPGLNSEILVFFAKIFRPEPLVATLHNASKDEYITRHLIDGRIINCDQRISLIAGYMIEEVQGHSAFLYMHREDVRWVMIALRQMYDKGESKGTSCYRLKSRNGEFIYLKTFGYLEIDDQGIVESFVCINTLVSEEVGQVEVRDLKKRFSALFNSSLANLQCNQDADFDSCSDVPLPLPPPPLQQQEPRDLTEDPVLVEKAVCELMRNLPSPGSDDSERSTQSPQTNSTSDNKCQSSSSDGSAFHRKVPIGSKPIHLKIKTGGKRAASLSPDHVKRQRLNSTNSETSQPSPQNPSTLAYSNGPSVNKIQKLEEQYSTSPSDISLHQQHHPA